MIKELFIFACGACLGSAATYYIVKKKCREETDLEVETIRNYYSSKSEKNTESDDSQEEEETETHNDIFKSSIEMYSSISIDDHPDVRIRESIEPEVEDVEQDFSDYIPGPSEGPNEKPFLISENMFSCENLQFDKIELTVWKDGIITDSDENIIDDVDDILGRKNVDFHKNAGEDGYIYIRNEKCGTDYALFENCLDYSGTHF